MKLLSQGIIKTGNLVKSPPLNARGIKRWHKRYFIFYDPRRTTRNKRSVSSAIEIKGKKDGSKNATRKLRSKSFRESVRRFTTSKKTSDENETEPNELVLLYYESEEKERKGALPIGKILCTDAIVAESKNKVNGYQFVINFQTKDRLFYLCAETLEEHKSWLKVFNDYLNDQRKFKRCESKDSLEEFLSDTNDSSNDILHVRNNSLLEQLSAWKKQRASINSSTQESYIFEENLKSGVFGYENLPGNKDSGYSDTAVSYNVLTPDASYYDKVESLTCIHKSSSLSNDETDILTRDTQNKNYKSVNDIYLSPSSFLSLKNEEKNFTLNQSNDISYPESDFISIDYLANKLSSCANLKHSSSYINGTASNNGLENMNSECYKNLISKKILNASCVCSNENEKNTQAIIDHLDGNPALKRGSVTRQYSNSNEDSKSVLLTCRQTTNVSCKNTIYPSNYVNYTKNDENYVNGLELYQSSTKKFPEISHNEEVFFNPDTLLQKARKKSLSKAAQRDEGEYMSLDPNKTNCISYDEDAPELPRKMMMHRRCSEPSSNTYACKNKQSQQPNRAQTQVVKFSEVNKCTANQIKWPAIENAKYEEVPRTQTFSGNICKEFRRPSTKMFK